jgi:hypothetical protein
VSLLWKPLLSATVPIDPDTGDFDWSAIPFPVYGSPKIDGYRSMIQRGRVVSRNGLLVLNREVQRRFGRTEFEGLDVELTAGQPFGDGVFNATSRVVKKADAKAEYVRMNVIDYVAQKHAMPFTFTQRMSVLRSSLGTSSIRDRGVYVIKQTLLKNIDQVKSFEASCLSDGYEGVMLRRADQGEYPQKKGKSNRSTLNEFFLARLKRFEVAIATIVAVYPLEHNVNEHRTGTGARSSMKAGKVVDADGLIGSATLRDTKTGVEFQTSVASAFLRQWFRDAAPRQWRAVPVRYKYQVCGTKDRPRINTCSFKELLP